MSTMLNTALAALIAASGVLLVFNFRTAVIRRRREQQAARTVARAVEAMEAEIAKLGARTINASRVPADSLAGRLIADILANSTPNGECACPNHEEERRIAHARKNAEAGE